MFLQLSLAPPAGPDLAEVLAELDQARRDIADREAVLEREIDALRMQVEDLRASFDVAAMASSDALAAMSERLTLAELRAHDLGLDLLAAEAKLLAWQRADAAAAWHQAQLPPPTPALPWYAAVASRLRRRKA